MARMISLKTKLTPRERYVVWLHLELNVVAQNGREQDQIIDLREALNLDEIDEYAEANRNVDHRDFSDAPEAAAEVELSKEELAFLLAMLDRAMPAKLVRFVVPIKARLARERDTQGLKAVKVAGGEG